MSLIIDAHLDLAYNALTFGRDYLRPVKETRRLEAESPTPERTGHSLVGWPELQRGQLALVVGTLFAPPRRYGNKSWEVLAFGDSAQAHHVYQQQLAYYLRLCDDHPDHFRLVLNRQDLRAVLEPWEKQPAYLPPDREQTPEEAEKGPWPEAVTHPVGIVLSMEGLEGLRAPEELEEWYEQGIRLAGMVWAGTRLCGGTFEPGDFTREGLAVLEVMADLGMTLDLSHMNEESTLQALDRYPGAIIASHANARVLLRGIEGERLFTDRTIRRLIERDGIMGVVPYNRFLKTTWSSGSPRSSVTLADLIAHIDHICQIAGDARHAGIGSDFDGGFGWQEVPQEINTVADLQKLAPLLADRGYDAESIALILGGNWRRHFERTFPE